MTQKEIFDKILSQIREKLSSENNRDSSLQFISDILKDNVEHYELYDFIKDKKEVNNLWDKTDEKTKAMYLSFLQKWEKRRTSFTDLNKPL